MASPEVVVPPRVRQRVLASGDEGAAWLTSLPELLEDVARQWSITLGESFAGGTGSYVARARTADGCDVVLEVAALGLDLTRQASTLARADGHGYVRLLASDDDRQALLLELLGSSLEESCWPPERTIPALCQTLRTAWTVAGPKDVVLPTTEEKAAQLGESVDRLWAHLGRPCPPQVVDRAMTYAERRLAAYDPAHPVWVHGDPHPGNALLVGEARVGVESGIVLIDPDGFFADPAYDLGVVLRDWCTELLAGDAPALARRYCRLLATHSGLDEVAIWEWGFLERVSTGLYVLEYGAEQVARRFLDSAERLL